MERHLALQASSSSSTYSSERDKVTSLFVSHQCSSSHSLYFTVSKLPSFHHHYFIFFTYDLRYKTSLPWHSLSSLILSYPVLSSPILFCPDPSCLIWTYPVLLCTALLSDIPLHILQNILINAVVLIVRIYSNVLNLTNYMVYRAHEYNDMTGLSLCVGPVPHGRQGLHPPGHFRDDSSLLFTVLHLVFVTCWFVLSDLAPYVLLTD